MAGKTEADGASGSLTQTVLLVSFAHALVHVLELSLSSAELPITAEFGLNPEQSGLLGSSLRFPYGFGAFFAGMLADRIGARRSLIIYLSGSAIVTLLLGLGPGVVLLYALMFMLGMFLSMYHPAGLALLAQRTTPATRSRALGIHGVLGSLGIASAPFLAALLFRWKPGQWQLLYLMLSAAAAVLALLLFWKLERRPVAATNVVTAAPEAGPGNSVESQNAASASVATEPSWPMEHRISYAALVASTAMAGIVYGGFLHFLPRYLSRLDLISGYDRGMASNLLTAVVLVCGAAGQYTAGRLARPHRLGGFLSLIYLMNVPLLVAMSVVDGTLRVAVTCVFAFVHFMSQPIYNSLLPNVIPRHRLSMGFGFSNAAGFGIGAVGPWFVGRIGSPENAYPWLSGLMVMASAIVFGLTVWRRSQAEASLDS